MKALLALPLIALAGCTTTAKDVETAMQKNLPNICAGSEVVHATFITAAPDLKLSAKTLRREASAYAAVRVFCVNPSSITIPDAVVRAAAAYATYLAVAKVGA